MLTVDVKLAFLNQLCETSYSGALSRADGDAGFDLRASHTAGIEPGQRATIGLGILTEIPDGWCALLVGRSGLASKAGIDVLGGLIDARYRGEWKVVLQNNGVFEYPVHAGDRICQAIFLPVPVVNFTYGVTLSMTDRGAAGFGSTGVSS